MFFPVLIIVSLWAWLMLACWTITKKKEKRTVFTIFSTLIMVLMLLVGVSIHNQPKQESNFIDISGLSADETYECFYNISQNPQLYVGKDFRVKGLFYSEEQEITGERLYYVVAVNSDGMYLPMDIVPIEGSVYPDDFPQNETEVCLEGTITAFEDETVEGQMYLALVLH